jgi:hypothetical protein
LPLIAPLLRPLDVPIDLGREEALRLARTELAKPVYAGEDEPFVQRAIRWLFDRIGELLDRAGSTSPLGWFGLLGIVALVVLVIVVVRRRTGSLGRAEAPDLLLLGGPRTAREHRADAERYAAAGAWAEAVRSRLRAIVRDLEDRGLVDARPGRTADEVARDAGGRLPAAAADLRIGARIFDDIWYGGRTADATAYARMVEIDTTTASARPSADLVPDTYPAVPR